MPLLQIPVHFVPLRERVAHWVRGASDPLKGLSFIKTFQAFLMFVRHKLHAVSLANT